MLVLPSNSMSALISSPLPLSSRSLVLLNLILFYPRHPYHHRQDCDSNSRTFLILDWFFYKKILILIRCGVIFGIPSMSWPQLRLFCTFVSSHWIGHIIIKGLVTPPKRKNCRKSSKEGGGSFSIQKFMLQILDL